MAEQESTPTTLQDLWNRRVFQYLGTYLGISFGLLQFMDFLVTRYDLSANLVDKLFIFLLALLPAVAVFIYNHGRPGHDSWRPFEKIFLPASLVIGLSLAMLLFNDSAARAATEQISISTVDGKEETRIVPKVEFTKRFAIFPFENTSGRAEEDWQSLGIGYLLDKDMEQFMMNYVISPTSMKQQYTAYNAEFLQPIPFATQLKIAQEYYTDYFVKGSFNVEEGKISLKAQLFETQNGKLFFETQIEGQDIYEVVDRLSEAFSQALYPKDNLPKLEFVDLPASELISGNYDALSAYIKSLAIYAGNPLDAPRAIEVMESVVRLDPNCAPCFSALSEMYFAASKESEMKKAANTAVTLAGTLPERQKLNINYFNYVVNNEMNKAHLMLNNWIKLYPHDYTPYAYLMTYCLQRNLWDQAEDIGLRAFENGHRGNLLYSLATIYISKREFDQAEQYIDQYYKMYPHKSKDHTLLERIYTGKGELTKAKALNEDALIMNPGDLDIIIQLGKLEDKMGNFKEAETYFQQALDKSRNMQDSVKVLKSMATHFERLGRYDLVFERYDQSRKLMEKYVPPAQLKQQFFFAHGFQMAITGREDLYFRLLEDVKEELPQNAPIFDCVGNYLFHMWRENREAFESYSEQCLETVILPMYGQSFALLDRAARAEIRGDFATAIEGYEQYQDSTGITDARMAYGLAAVYRKNNNYDKALELVEEGLISDPNDPILLLEKAQNLFNLSKLEDASTTWKRVMSIWDGADEDYQYYQDALELGAKMKNN